jgi:hypothetical protein
MVFGIVVMLNLPQVSFSRQKFATVAEYAEVVESVHAIQKVFYLLLAGMNDKCCFSLGQFDLLDNYTTLCSLTNSSPFPCPAGSVCRDSKLNPNGVSAFDNIFQAWLTALQVVSLEGWTEIMYQV